MNSSIFHFTNMDNGFQILENMKLKFNSIYKSNDPWENLNQYNNFKAHHSDGINGLQNALAAMDKTNNCIKALEKYKILCFSMSFKYKNKIIAAFNQPRMWAQYGDNHRGFCFEFDIEKIKESCDNSNTEFNKFEKVNYRDQTKKIDLSRLNEESVEKIINSYYKRFFFLKNINWKDEHEFRILRYSDEELFLNIQSAIKGIYLGVNFPTTYYPLIDFYTKKIKVPIYRMRCRDLDLNKEKYKQFCCIDGNKVKYY